MYSIIFQVRHDIPLTRKQEQVLAYYMKRQRQTGVFPTLQEAADHFGYKSRNAVRQHLRLIEKKGAVRHVPGRPRALELLRRGAQGGRDWEGVPLLGVIPAGNPSTAFEDAEELLDLPAGLFHGHELFALRVRGRSMEGAGILSGDIAILNATPVAKDGTIAAVLIEDEATLKRVYHTREALVLKAENQAFGDIAITAGEAEQPRIIGVLVGILRKV